MTDKAEFQKVFDAWPEEEPLLPYDDFFVGGSSDAEHPGYKTESFANQLTNIRTVKDLRDPAPERAIPTEDDTNEFITDRVDLLSFEQYGELFFAIKRAVYNLFDFTTLRSASLGDVPMQELDLVMNEDDYYVIDYLKDVTKDYYKVAQVAVLTAYDNMGISLVRFCQHDDCALCRAHDGLFYEIRSLLELLGSGGNVTHPYCECTWAPVIQRERYAGPLSGHLDRDLVEVDGQELRNVPVEFLREITEIAATIPYKVIKFVDMVDYLLNESTLVENSRGVVAFVQGEELLVHNSYVGVYGPLQFLWQLAKTKPLPATISLEGTEDAEVYYVGGRAAIKQDGKFWDAETGERLA